MEQGSGSLLKASTGIAGFDDITGGGLPRARTSLVVGGPGSGKTLLALHFLVEGAQCAEAGIFVAFEEASERIVANAESFGWGLADLCHKALFFVDAQPDADVIRAGDFDLGGMCAALDVIVQTSKAKRIVFDALDVVLSLLPDAAARRREIYRIHGWLLERDLTGIVTLKAGGEDAVGVSEKPFSFMQFMVDCAVILNHTVVRGISQRSLRVQKYRGSSFDENELPFLIGKHGLELSIVRSTALPPTSATMERVSSGIARLDTMLNGGYFRGASVLITGFSGTAKTTLSGAFAEAACKRGERTLFVSFDSDAHEVSRNLSSVGIHLDRHTKSGVLRIISARTITGSAEAYLVHIKALTLEHEARCLVVDPVSTWAKSINDPNAQGVTERLIDWAKTLGITLLCTRLYDEMSGELGGSSQLQVSTLADTWIHLSYHVQAGERNRGLSIIKSRGTAHSNQVRELVLSDSGVALADTYTAAGEVLMGTLRWEKERDERNAAQAESVARTLKRVRLEAEEAELRVRLKSLEIELEAKEIEKALLVDTTGEHLDQISREKAVLGEMRGADQPSKRKRGRANVKD